jgi:hypothetical protein
MDILFLTSVIGRSLVERLLTLRTRITAGVPLSVIAVQDGSLFREPRHQKAMEKLHYRNSFCFAFQLQTDC